MTQGEAEWRYDTGGGGVALCHRGRLSGAVTPGEAGWRCDTGRGRVAL